MIAVPATAAVAAAPTDVARKDLSVEQAATEARRSGQAVEATGAASSTDKVVARPDGKVTLTRSALPSRKRVDGRWKELDATLVRNADGSISPTLAQDQLRLAGRAGEPMAVMGSGGLSLTVDTSVPLTAPELDGDTAVYREILSGVDLRVTASITGGFSEVFIVKNAEAAKDLDPAKLALRTQASGVSLSSDETGNITGKDRVGSTVLTAPAPLMWDSTPAPGKSFRAPDGVEVNAQTRMPARSSLEGPGAGARTARVGAAVRAGNIELTPDAKLLTRASTYPVYIDPTFHWDSVGAKNNGWATLPRQFPGTNYWKDTPDPLGRMQVGNSGEISSRTFINFPMPNSTLAGAKIDAATFKITQTRAWSCTPSRVNLYAPATTLSSSNATWNYWDGRSLGSVVDYQTVAHGYNDSCRPDGVPFDVKSAIADNVSSGKKTQTFVLSAGNESDTNAWKEFLETSPTLSITFNHKPNKPTGMTTSPKTSCAATVPTVVGDGVVTLYAPVSDRNASVLGVNFTLWKSSASGTLLESTNPDLLTYKSGSTAVFRVNVATLRAAAGTAVTKFSWRVRVTDFDMFSDWSATCSFQFDASRTGAPVMVSPAEGAASIGSSVTIPVSPPETGTVPTSYLYQLNGGPYGTTNAVGGATEITVIPTRFTNTLTVTGLSPGGNIGDTAAVTFNATPAATAMDNDFNGDNLADLLTVGGANNLAAGLWLAPGKGTGALAPAAGNIGSQGNGLFLTNKPTDFNGAQIITGRFAGYGLQDVLAYYPEGNSPGVAVVLRGNGDGSTIQAQLDGNYDGIQAGTLTDNNGLNPRQLANAGYPGGAAYPDLIGISGDAQGYYLNYYPNMGMVGGYGLSATLPAQTTPTGAVDWDTWTLASAQTATGTAMFLWQRATGKLYLWDDLTYDGDHNTLSYTQHLLSEAWNAGQSLTPQAADINGDDIADLWAVGANGNTTPWLVSGLTPDAGTITAGAPNRVLTGTHMWLLNDAAEGPVTDAAVAKDSIGNLAATGAGKAQWNSGDLFSPSLELDSGPDSALRTTGSAVNTNADFTVAAWVKISKAGGVVMSQDGPKGAAFRVWAESSDSSWRFALPSNNTASPAWTVAAARAGTVKTDVWTHLSASFKKSTGVMDLHVNGIDVASAVHLTPWSSTGAFRIGVQLNPTGALGGFLKGQIAEVSTYDQVVLYDKGNPAIRDFNGDIHSDVFGVHSNTRLYLYRGNGAGRFQAAGGGIIGTGWDDFTAVVSPGDFTGDGFTDVIARKADGSLKLYRGNGASGWLNGKAPDSIGTGWNQFNLIFSPGDFTGDGKSDVLARKPDGSLWLYRGNGTGGWLNGTAPEPAGTGWHNLTAVFSPGDFTGDGKPDAIGRQSDGTLQLYRGNGTGGWTGDSTPVGSGWNQFNAIFSPGDFSGDGKPDVFARKPDGALWLYRGNGTGSWLNGNAPDNVGNGWHTFSKLF
jgi:hypothetical protein